MLILSQYNVLYYLSTTSLLSQYYAHTTPVPGLYYPSTTFLLSQYHVPTIPVPRSTIPVPRSYYLSTTFILSQQNKYDQFLLVTV